MDKNQALQNIAKKGKTEVAVLETELTEIISQMPDSPDRERLAMRELNNRYSGPPDKTVKFDVCIVGLYNLTDFNRKATKTAMDAYKADKEGTLERGMVQLIDGEPVAIDLKETFGDNIKNNNYGKPLGHSYNRNVLVLAKEDGTLEWKMSTIALRGDFSSTSLPEMHKVLKCNLLGEIVKELKTAKSTKFTVSDEAVDFNTVLTDIAKDHIVMLGDCLTEAKKHDKKEKGFYNRFVITSGECRFMNDPKKEGGNFNGTFDDFTTDKMITAFVDPALGKPDIGAEYTLIAQTSVKKEQKKNESGEYVDTDEDALIMNVMGYYS